MPGAGAASGAPAAGAAAADVVDSLPVVLAVLHTLGIRVVHGSTDGDDNGGIDDDDDDDDDSGGAGAGGGGAGAGSSSSLVAVSLVEFLSLLQSAADKQSPLYAALRRVSAASFKTDLTNKSYVPPLFAMCAVVANRRRALVVSIDRREHRGQRSAGVQTARSCERRGVHGVREKARKLCK